MFLSASVFVSICAFKIILNLFQILAFLLKRKNDLLNTHILHLIFSLVGTVRSDRELGSIPNVVAFNDLLCDFEVCIHSSRSLSFSSTTPFLFNFHRKSQSFTVVLKIE